MDKFKEFIGTKTAKVGVVTVGVLPLLTSFASAAEGDTSSAITTALTATAGEITTTIASIGPIALTVAGTFLVWRYGMRFFKSISK